MNNDVKKQINELLRDGAFAIFLDIDGTLMSGGELPAENVEAIKKAQERGHKVLLNTGRSYSFIPWKKLLPIRFDGICAGCGSHVKIADEVLRSVEVDRGFVVRVIDEYKKSGRPLFLEGEDACFWVNPNERERANKMLMAAEFPCYELVCGEQFEREFKDQRISKFTFWQAGMTKEEKELWSEELRVIEHPTYTESVIWGCDKAKGMQTALAAFDIPRCRSIAMGDSANDTEMLEYAGFSVAMGNSTDEVKRMCSYVSTNASDAGVAKAIYDLLGIE